MSNEADEAKAAAAKAAEAKAKVIVLADAAAKCGRAPAAALPEGHKADVVPLHDGNQAAARPGEARTAAPE